MSCGLLTEADQLVELVQDYIGHYKECAAPVEQCVLEKLEETIVQECQNQDARKKVNDHNILLISKFIYEIFFSELQETWVICMQLKIVPKTSQSKHIILSNQCH